MKLKNPKMTQIKNKKIVLVLLLLIPLIQIKAQITINSSDMPSSGDIVVTSTGLNLDFINYQETGEDFNWDFSQLTPISQNADTFISITDVPLIYVLYFGSTSNLVKKDNNTIPIPGFPITKQYSFLKNSSSSYNNAGVLYTISGIPVPLKFSSPDIIYHLPMEYENTGSSYAEYSIGMTDIGYIRKEISRSNTVDGWGTLTTPYGTFEVLRLKSEITEFDSIYMDSLGIGLPLYREYTEYSWLGKNHKLPLLQITSSFVGTVATYVDSLRFPSAIHDNINTHSNNITIFPNPTSDIISISFKSQTQSGIEIEIYDVNGKNVASKNMQSAIDGVIKISLKKLNLNKGLYFVKIITNNQKIVSRVVLY